MSSPSVFERFGVPSFSIDIDSERDPHALIAAARDILDGHGTALHANLPWDAHQLATSQRRLILLERITKRLRVVMTMQLGPAEDRDWDGVDRAVGVIDRRERTAPGGFE